MSEPDARRDEKHRREEAQATEADVQPGGHEVPGRAFPQGVRRREAILNVHINAQELESLEWAARVRRVSVSQFLRECGLQVAAQPYVEVNRWPETHA